MKGSYTHAFKVEGTKAICHRSGDEKKKKTAITKKPHIFYLKPSQKPSRVFVCGLSHPRWRKIRNYGRQNQSSISYCFVLFVILVIIIFILIDFFWFSNFGAWRCKFEHFR